MAKDVNCFNGVKVFSATMQPDREAIGNHITSWLAAHPAVRVVDVSVNQSSDDSFHCLTIILFFVEDARAASLTVEPRLRRAR
jgi:hypothetical protein